MAVFLTISKFSDNRTRLDIFYEDKCSTWHDSEIIYTTVENVFYGADQAYLCIVALIKYKSRNNNN